MRWIRRRWRFVLLALSVLGGVATGGWLQYRAKYPYGWSHSCDKQLVFALGRYADEHGGAYPTGEATPEASLSLLYPKYANEWGLQGKTVPLKLVKLTLERGDRLGPDTCGWHYVEGLMRGDDKHLALFWDKVGLGHNGERRLDGGRTVFFVNLESEYVTGAEWPAFLEAQGKLLATLKKKASQ